MRLRHRTATMAEGDMTPMIDMTFQLIAFFMVLINFSEADVNERIKLPSSALAKPPDAPLEHPIFLQLTREGTVLIGGDEVAVPALKSHLVREAQVLELKKKSPADAMIIIRADADAKTGVVQEVVQVCQETRFERFALRAKEDAD